MFSVTECGQITLKIEANIHPKLQNNSEGKHFMDFHYVDPFVELSMVNFT